MRVPLLRARILRKGTFFDRGPFEFRTVTIRRLGLPFMKLNWASAPVQVVTSARWSCGYCGAFTGTNQGWQGSDADAGHKMSYIRLCANCGGPTYFYAQSDVYVPAAKPGRSVTRVPADTDQLYNEARLALQVGACTASVMACRKVLSHIATDHGAPAGETFLAYVEYLAKGGFVPPNGKGWVDYIRKRGNDANHQIALMTKEDAEAVLSLTEHLLRNVYELPGLVPPNPK
jgi:hypothetical protein